MEQDSIFLNVFGRSPKMKVLDFLLTYQSFDYSLSEIVEKTGVSYTILQNIFQDFLKSSIVVETRKVGKARMFKLNEESLLAKQLLSLQWSIAKNPPIMVEKRQVEVAAS